MSTSPRLIAGLIAAAAACGGAPSAPAPAPAPSNVGPAASAAGSSVDTALGFMTEDVVAIAGFDMPRVAAAPMGKWLLARLAANLLPGCDEVLAATPGHLTVATDTDGFVGVADAGVDERGLGACLHARVRKEGDVLLFADRQEELDTALDPRAPRLRPALRTIVDRADRARMVWVAVLLRPEDLTGMGVPPGFGIVSGDLAVRAWVELGTAAEIDLVVAVASADDAARLAQALSDDMTRHFPTLRVEATGSEVHATLTIDEANASALFGVN